MKLRCTTSFVLAIIVAFSSSANLRADVRLPRIFSDHMVLQRQAPVSIWGWADAGEEVTVSFAGQSKTAKPEVGGKWLVKLDKLAGSGPQVLTVKGKNTLTVNDVLVGEVWLCSGQSNMAMTVNRAKDFAKEQPAANFPSIRMFTVERSPHRAPQIDCKGTWIVCSPQTVGAFSAVAYFFGRDIYQKINVPVGLINSSYGGTDIAAWTSMDVQKDLKELKPVFEPWDKAAATWDEAKAKAEYEKQLAVWNNWIAKGMPAGAPLPRQPEKPVPPRENRNHPATLFNGMIAPLVGYTIRGALWYQGERNSKSSEAGYLYRIQLPLLIEDWRRRWGQGDFPFAWVQLPNFIKSGDGWMLVRESMLQTLKLPNTGMAVTVDIGDPRNIHPTNKQDVGKRLAMWALGSVYGEKVASSGPLYVGHETKGSELILSFKSTDGGLVSKDGDLRGFMIAGPDKKWLKAAARINGDRIILSHPDIREPVAVRYAWADNPDCNLYNGAGLPASPFRTDKN